jgi:hypothetical protein
MTQDEILDMFRQRAETLDASTTANGTINDLANLLAQSRGRLSKENFDALLQIGAVLYKDGLSQFRARSEVTAMMNKSVEDQNRK